MPATGRLEESDLGRRLGIEIATTEACSAAAGLNEALSVAVEPCGIELTCDVQDDVLCDGLGLTFGEHASHRKRLAGLEGDSGDVANGIHTSEPCVEGVAVDGDPARVVDETGLRKVPCRSS